MSRNLRYLILLSILLFVVVNETQMKSRSTSWEHPLWVRVFAINGDGRDPTARYIAALNERRFEPVERFVNREAKRFGVAIDAIEVKYGGQIDSLPPQPPSGRNILENVWWSLRFRYWASSHEVSDGEVMLFVSYFDTATTQSLRHSVGLQGGLIGLINAFAANQYRGSNQVVIAHELMHTLGARDRYAVDNTPIHPDGFAEPWRKPLYPQRLAEIMGGRIPVAPNRLRMPQSLKEVVIGPLTAAEINWPVAPAQ